MLSVSFRKRLKGFSLDVEFESEGRVTALFAPSGSGKSLTLQTIAGLIKPDEGKIKVGRKVFFDSSKKVNLPPQKRKVGYLFQDYALFPNMSVIENVRYGGNKGVENLLKVLEIDSIRDRYPNEISGGQKQRVALARALASKPEILLLDEPFSALHKSLKTSLYGELKRIQEMFNIPVVLVTHDIDEVFELSDTVVILRDGRVIQSGKPFDVFMNPADEDTARLLGHKSFISGTVVSVEGEYALVKLSDGNTLKCRQRGRIGVGEKVKLSILPFSVALSPSQEAARVDVLIRRISKKRQIMKVEVVISGTSVELEIPSSLSPNLILEEGRFTSIYLSAEFIPVLKEVA